MSVERAALQRRATKRCGSESGARVRPHINVLGQRHLPLPVKQENRCHGRQRGQDLQNQDWDRPSGCSRNPLDREEQDDGNLASHENLPNVSSRTLVWLGRRSVGGEEDQYDPERSERHRDGYEGARVFQYAQGIRFAHQVVTPCARRLTLRFSGGAQGRPLNPVVRPSWYRQCHGTGQAG